jgi:hypothetical protein
MICVGGGKGGRPCHCDESGPRRFELQIAGRVSKCGAPLSALGIRALWKLCIDGVVFNALEQTNSIEVEVGKRLASAPDRAVLKAVPEGVTIN